MNYPNVPSVSDIVEYLNELDESHIVLGYGSLLSRDSRERYSQINTLGIPVMVSGFERAWVTRSIQEQQTYVGAIKNSSKKLNAQLIPTQLNPALQEREKDYRFSQVSADQITFDLATHSQGNLKTGAQLDELYEVLSAYHLWVCETLECSPATEAFPVSQTYIDTCLAGCIEHAGEKAARDFVIHTSMWDHPRINDRALPKYPRAAKVSADMHEKIDAVLATTLSQ